MSAAKSKPSIFIASSAEKLDVAYAIQESLEYDAEPTVWTQDIFKPTSYTLPDLMKAARSHQFAIFVFAPDDLLLLRDQRIHSIRDNVIFELGLFIGALGLERCFFLLPRGVDTLHLPSDLLGVSPLTYVADRSDGNLVAALGPACNRIRRAIHDLAGLAQPTVTTSAPAPVQAEDFLTAWDGPELSSARNIVREWGLFDPYDPDFQEVRPALQHLFAFFEAAADAILSGRIDEKALRNVLERPIVEFWPHLYTALAPPNHVDEWWDPPPKVATLYAQWAKRTES